MEAGAHFGHQTRRWNPKMKLYIFEEKNGLYIINLAKTLYQLRHALPQVCKVIKENKPILFVGTKKQAKCVIKEAAIEAGEYFVAERWLGGMLTNMTTIRNSIKTLDKIEKDLTQNSSYLTKKEIALLGKRHQKLLKNLEGIRYLRKIPGLVIVVDPSYEKIAVAEAKKLGIPVLALVDTNCDPTPIDYVVPCNDDSLKSIRLIINAIKENIVNTKKKLGVEIVSPIKALNTEDASEEIDIYATGDDNRHEDLLAKKYDSNEAN
ncbi:30S ribosomal protein S2 [Chlamydia poikilotherma]